MCVRVKCTFSVRLTVDRPEYISLHVNRPAILCIQVYFHRFVINLTTNRRTRRFDWNLFYLNVIERKNCLLLAVRVRRISARYVTQSRCSCGKNYKHLVLYNNIRCCLVLVTYNVCDAFLCVFVAHIIRNSLNERNNTVFF